MFEYDAEKSDINYLKHGIDFKEAEKLWKDGSLTEINSTFEEEKRFAVIGKIEEKHWTAIITYREKSIRIISVRRARKKEVIYYERRRIRQNI